MLPMKTSNTFGHVRKQVLICPRKYLYLSLLKISQACLENFITNSVLPHKRYFSVYTFLQNTFRAKSNGNPSTLDWKIKIENRDDLRIRKLRFFCQSTRNALLSKRIWSSTDVLSKWFKSMRVFLTLFFQQLALLRHVIKNRRNFLFIANVKRN